MLLSKLNYYTAQVVIKFNYFTMRKFEIDSEFSGFLSFIYSICIFFIYYVYEGG